MRRAPYVIAGTVAGLGLLLSFHTKPVTVSLGAAGSKSSPGSSTASGSSPSGSSSGSVSGSSTSSTSGTRSAVGAPVNYYYGVVAVKVTASGSHVTKVSVASLDDGGNFRSVSIDQASIPVLEQEALSAQSANIQSVSGATYTSAGFAQSLQSALKKLGL